MMSGMADAAGFAFAARFFFAEVFEVFFRLAMSDSSCYVDRFKRLQICAGTEAVSRDISFTTESRRTRTGGAPEQPIERARRPKAGVEGDRGGGKIRGSQQAFGALDLPRLQKRGEGRAP